MVKKNDYEVGTETIRYMKFVRQVNNIKVFFFICS